MRNEYRESDPPAFGVFETSDGRFQVRRNGEPLPHLPKYAAPEKALRQAELLIQEAEGTWDHWGRVAGWTAPCPNCGDKRSLTIARTEGRIIHQCTRHESLCTYEKDVGPVPR